MLEDTPGQEPTTTPTDQTTAAGTQPRATETPATESPATDAPLAEAPAARKTAARKTTARKTTARTSTAKKAAAAPEGATEEPAGTADQAPDVKPAKKTAARRTAKKAAAAPAAEPEEAAAAAPSEPAAGAGTALAGEPADTAPASVAAPLFQPPDPALATPTRARKPRKAARPDPEAPAAAASSPDGAPSEIAPEDDATDSGDESAGTGESGQSADTAETGDGGARRRRRRGGRRRRKAGDAESAETNGSDDEATDEADDAESPTGDEPGKDEESSSSRRRRRRRRSGEDGGEPADDPQNTVTRVRKSRSAEDQITSVTGSTRLEAKKQRRREGREAGRRRAPIVSEAEFLARRESVDRVMAIRQRDDLTQIAVLEDKVLVEHYVARESQTSLIGNVYLGRVQNVLPSMEAAFVDIGKGRNAVLYAGEVNWSALGHKDGQPRKIESVLSSGQPIMVQVTKDPVGHKGARLSSQISLAGRFLVYVPDGTNSGISRKLPDTERNRLKALLKEIVPEGAGVIVRTAAEGASEEELTRDVERLKARWEDIEKKAKGSAPQLLYGEPDLTLKVVRDLFTEDFSKLAIQGEDAWETVSSYVSHVAPDLEPRLEKYADGTDIFAAYRIDEQIAKGLDRKVWLPSGGSLVIDRTEAMTVVDVNTGKFTGSGGNLEETVTKNNLEAAEEIVRQLRLRDIGGIIVIDFIDMVLESNRDLVLRRLVECLGRDRTRHQVAEVTSLGLVQMTRKRIGTGLLEAFSETCAACGGRGLLVTEAPVEPRKAEEEPRRARRSRGKGRGGDSGSEGQEPAPKPPSPKDVAAMARPVAHAEEDAEKPRADEPAAAEPEGSAAEPESTTAEPEDRPAAAPEPAVRPEPEDTTTDTATVAQPGPEHPGDAPAPRPAEQPDAADQPAPASTTPTVVTRTRRRSARRPAGPPAGIAASPPPAATGAVAEPPADGPVEPGLAEAERAPAPVEHVPVKKRGSRKR